MIAIAEGIRGAPDSKKVIADVIKRAESPDVKEYRIGLTSQAPERRAYQYKRDFDRKYHNIYNNFCVLVESLTSQEAVDLENDIHKYIFPRVGEVCYDKYDPTARHCRKSTGGPRKSGQVYSVYMAWKN